MHLLDAKGYATGRSKGKFRTLQMAQWQATEEALSLLPLTPKEARGSSFTTEPRADWIIGFA